MDKEDKKRLSKAHTLANWSYIGLFIPILGWILSSMSKSITRSLSDDAYTKSDEKKIKDVNQKITNGAMLSWIGFVIFLGLGFYNYKSSANRAFVQEQQAQSQAQKAASDTSAKEASKIKLQNTCLTNAYDKYKENWLKASQDEGRSDGKLSSGASQLQEQRYQSAKDDCYR